jgi:hypothetical protein
VINRLNNCSSERKTGRRKKTAPWGRGECSIDTLKLLETPSGDLGQGSANSGEKGPWTTVESMTRSSRIQGNPEAGLLASAGEFGTGAASSGPGSEISNLKPTLKAKQPIMPLVIELWASLSQILAMLPTPAHRCNHTRITDGTRTNGLARRQSQLARRTQSFVGRREGLLGEKRSHGTPEEFARVAVGRLISVRSSGRCRTIHRLGRRELYASHSQEEATRVSSTFIRAVHSA